MPEKVCAIYRNLEHSRGKVFLARGKLPRGEHTRVIPNARLEVSRGLHQYIHMTYTELEEMLCQG